MEECIAIRLRERKTRKKSIYFYLYYASHLTATKGNGVENVEDTGGVFWEPDCVMTLEPTDRKNLTTPALILDSHKNTKNRTSSTTTAFLCPSLSGKVESPTCMFVYTKHLQRNQRTSVRNESCDKRNLSTLLRLHTAASSLPSGKSF